MVELVAEVTGEKLDATAEVDKDKRKLPCTSKILPEFPKEF